MITNERQHRITKAEIKRFEHAIAHSSQDHPVADLHPRLREAMTDGIQSQLDELREELEQYEALREGRVRRRVLTSLLDLPAALIEGRIVRHLTQKDLGQKLGVPEQQIQRYEKTRYAGVGLDRLQEVADAVGITLKKTIEYDVKASASGRAHTTAKRRGKPSAATVQGKTAKARSKGGARMAGRKTGKAAASAAGKTLGSKSTSKAAKRAAASDLAQAKSQKVTGKKAASAAGKTLASRSSSKTAKRAAASDLSQTAGKKKR
jgi:transcriptional regulator with XRE-family HTH domain